MHGIHAGGLADRLPYVVCNHVSQRAAGRGERELDLDRIVGNLDVVDQTEIDDIQADFRVDYSFESLEDSAFGRHGPSSLNVSKVLKNSCKIKAAILLDTPAASPVRYQEMGETPNRRGAMLLLAHPDERSLNHAVAETAAEAVRAAGVELFFHDLYAEGFEAVLSKEEMLRRFSFDEAVQRYAGELRRAQLLIVVHPDWWGQPPAVLKGWLDRVLRPGVAYDYRGEEFMEKHRVPLLTGMRALVFATSDAVRPPAASPLERTWRENVFEFCGIGPSEITIFYEVRAASRRTRTHWLQSAADAVRRYAAEAAHR